MANSKKSAEQAAPATQYNQRRWAIPKNRAKNYAEERKVKVHKHGPKRGRQLTDYEAGLRSGYLQCQTDHAGLFKYKKALEQGHTKEEARVLSQQKWKK